MKEFVFEKFVTWKIFVPEVMIFTWSWHPIVG